MDWSYVLQGFLKNIGALLLLLRYLFGCGLVLTDPKLRNFCLLSLSFLNNHVCALDLLIRC